MNQDEEEAAMDETVYSPNPDRDKSVIFQLANVEFETYDDNSQDLFDDDESSVHNSPIINLNESYQTTRAISTPNTHLASSFVNTPKITNNWSVTRATVPSIPMSLVPFISTVNESWNSELETPEAKDGARTATEYAGHERFSESIQSAERRGGSSARSYRNGVVPEMKTPRGCFVVDTEDEELCISPIINTTMNRRRRPKRRILKSLGDTTACSESPKKNTDASESLLQPPESPPHVGDIHILGNEEMRNVEKGQNEGEVKEELGFVTFTELCMRKGEHGENGDLETTSRSNPSSPRKDVDSALKEEKPSPSLEKDEPLIDSVEFTPWLYQSDKENVESSEAHVTNELTKENQRLFETEQLAPSERDGPILMKENVQMPKYSLHSCGSIGFTTAGGKPIKVSEKKIKNAEKMYKELSLGDGITGSGKSLGRKISGDEFFPSNKENQTRNSHYSIGFSTAGGKPIKISEEKLKNAEKIYNQLSLEDGMTGSGKSSSRKISGDKFFPSNKENETRNFHTPIGFSTAGGRPITISEEKLKNAEKMYNKLSIEDGITGSRSFLSHEMPGDKLTSTKENAAAIPRNSSTPIGFSTAAGKPIKISEEKLKNSEKIYKELTLEDGITGSRKSLSRIISEDKFFPSSEENETRHSHTPIGFSTASGKPIRISEEKLKNAEKIYNELFIENGITGSHKSLSHKIPEDRLTSTKENATTIQRNSSTPIGFSTTGGKPINISEEKLKNAERIYNELSLENRITGSGPSSSHTVLGNKLTSIKENAATIRRNSCTSIGFSTADGNPIKISEEKLKNAEKIYNELSIENGITVGHKSLSHKIPGDKLTSTKENVATIQRNSSTPIGFFTTDEKPIKISKEKVKNADEVHKELSLMDETYGRISMSFEIVEDNHANTHRSEGWNLQSSHSSIGFSTAGGKPISVSEDKLKAAEKLYHAVNSTDELSIASAPRGVKRQRESNTAANSSGFKTASGKPLVFSETAVKKARFMYDSEKIEERKVFEKPEKQLSSEISEDESEEMLLGFCTVSGKALMTKPGAKGKITSLKSDGLQSLGPKAAVDDNLTNEMRRMDNNNYSMNKKSRSLTEGKQILLKNYDSIHRPLSSDSINSLLPISVGFATAGGKMMKISDQALSKAKGLLENEQEETPLILQTSKRPRVGSDLNLQARKLFSEEDSKVDKNHAVGARAKTQMFGNDRLMTPKLEPQRCWPLNRDKDSTEFGAGFNDDDKVRKAQTPGNGELETYSEEITASTVALQEDEDKSLDGKPWGSEISCTSAAIQDRDISAKPITIGGGDVQEIPTSPIIGSKLRANKKMRRNKKRRELKIEGVQLKINRDNEILQDQILTEGSRRSSGATTPTSDSSKASFRNESPLLETVLESKLERSRGSGGSDEFSEVIPSEMDDNYLEARIAATLEQERKIRIKKKHKPKPIVGSLLLRRMNNKDSRISWREATSRNPPVPRNPHEASSSKGNCKELEDQPIKNIKKKKMVAEQYFQRKNFLSSSYLQGCGKKLTSLTFQPAKRSLFTSIPLQFYDRPIVCTNELTNCRIASDAIEMTAATALSYKFRCSDFYSKNDICSNPDGLEMGDGFRLIFDDNGFAGAAEFERAFIAGPGVDPDLVPEKWVGNHYRWIVWKLASMDRMKFGDATMPRMLTPCNVMEQLKYRHDREIDKSERPALRRIIEKDDPPCRRMVLCVATVTKLEDTQGSEKSPKTPLTSHFKMELTDGWYSIPATIDSAMANLIAFGKIREGTKLITSRAELLNCDQGCSPLEIPGEASLKIHTNSTRRSRWDAKLGYCKYSSPISTSLSSILPNGGLIGKLNTVIARVYPNQFFEKTWSGTPIFRNNKCEDKAAMKYEEERQAQLESICSKAQADFEARNRRHSKTFSAGSSRSEDPDSYQVCSSDGGSKSSRMCDEAAESEAFQKELESILRESLPPPRKVTMILKVRLMGGENPAILTVWAPNEDTIDLIKEGNRVSIHNVQTSGKRSGDLQLTAGHQSFVKLEGSNVPSFPQRQLTPIPEVGVLGFNPPFGEFDTVGIVVSLGPAPHGMKNFEVVDLAYPPSSEAPGVSTYLSILFWEGIGAHGFSDILTVGSIVACNNLQWRRGAPRTIPLAYSTEHSTFTRNPRQNYLRSAFESVKNRITDCISFVSQCAVEIALERQKKSTILRSPALYGTPSKGSPSASYFSPGMSPQTPQGPPNTGKDCTPAKYSMQRRLEKLQWYGEPPDLSPVTLKHGSNKFNQRFIPPVRTPEH